MTGPGHVLCVFSRFTQHLVSSSQLPSRSPWTAGWCGHHGHSRHVAVFGTFAHHFPLPNILPHPPLTDVLFKYPLLQKAFPDFSFSTKQLLPHCPPQLFLLCPSQSPPPSDDSGSQPPRATGQRPWLRQTTDCGHVSAGRRRRGLRAGGYQGPPLAVPCVLDAWLWLRLVLWSQEGGCSSRCHTGSHPLSRPRKPFQEHSACARHLPVTGRRQGHPGLHLEGSSQSLIQLGLCQQWEECWVRAQTPELSGCSQAWLPGGSGLRAWS